MKIFNLILLFFIPSSLILASETTSSNSKQPAPPTSITLHVTASPEMNTAIYKILPQLENELNIRFERDSLNHIYLLSTNRGSVATLSVAYFRVRKFEELNALLISSNLQSAAQWLDAQVVGEPPINRLFLFQNTEVEIYTNLKNALEFYLNGAIARWN